MSGPVLRREPAATPLRPEAGSREPRPPRDRHVAGLLDPRHEGTRRALNVVVAAVGIVLSSPLMIAVAALIKLTSRGPVIFRQTRVGLDRRAGGASHGEHRRRLDYGGRLFTMYKFRTMRADASSRQIWARDDDDRITPLGHLLRKARLDELPQLFNVLKGDMNVVGPRPEQPQIFVELCEQIEAYPRRQRVRPGITGWAQINLPYDGSVHDVRQKVAYDLQYIWRQSTLEDLRIMLRTLPVMVFGEGSR